MGQNALEKLVRAVLRRAGPASTRASGFDLPGWRVHMEGRGDVAVVTYYSSPGVLGDARRYQTVLEADDLAVEVRVFDPDHGLATLRVRMEA